MCVAGMTHFSFSVPLLGVHFGSRRTENSVEFWRRVRPSRSIYIVLHDQRQAQQWI